MILSEFHYRFIIVWIITLEFIKQCTIYMHTRWRTNSNARLVWIHICNRCYVTKLCLFAVSGSIDDSQKMFLKDYILRRFQTNEEDIPYEYSNGILDSFNSLILSKIQCCYNNLLIIAVNQGGFLVVCKKVVLKDLKYENKS